MFFLTDYDWDRLIAETIYKIGKNRLDDLLRIEMSHNILQELIKLCSPSKISEISDGTLLNLLNSKEDKVRKFASLKSIQSFKKSKIKSLLKNYVDSEEYRYYNVIFWLDFGVSMLKSVTTRAMKFIVN